MDHPLIMFILRLTGIFVAAGLVFTLIEILMSKWRDDEVSK